MVLHYITVFQNVRQMILEFMRPISIHHGVNLLGAVGVVWNDRRQNVGQLSSKGQITLETFIKLGSNGVDRHCHLQTIHWEFQVVFNDCR